MLRKIEKIDCAGAKLTESLNLSVPNYEFRKYRLLEIINSKPYYETVMLKRNLPSLLGITRQRLHRWLNLPIEDNREIPFSYMVKLAGILEVEHDELINFHISPLNPLNLPTTAKAKRNVALGLVSGND